MKSLSHSTLNCWYPIKQSGQRERKTMQFASKNVLNMASSLKHSSSADLFLTGSSAVKGLISVKRQSTINFCWSRERN